MASKKDSKPKTPIQPVPEKRGYEFGGPYVLSYCLHTNFEHWADIVIYC